MKRALDYPLVDSADVGMSVFALFQKYPALDAVIDEFDIPIFRDFISHARVTAEMQLQMSEQPRAKREKVTRGTQECVVFREGFDFWESKKFDNFRLKISITEKNDDEVYFVVDDALDLDNVIDARNKARATLTPERLEVVMKRLFYFFDKVWKKDDLIFPIKAQDVYITRDDRILFKPFCYFVGKNASFPTVSEVRREIIQKVLDAFDRECDAHLRKTLIARI